MSVKDIIIEALKKMGADGLCNPGCSCGCGLGDFDCEEVNLDCEPARKIIATQEDVDEMDGDFEVGDEIYVTANFMDPTPSPSPAPSVEREKMLAFLDCILTGEEFYNYSPDERVAMFESIRTLIAAAHELGMERAGTARVLMTPKIGG